MTPRRSARRSAVGVILRSPAVRHAPVLSHESSEHPPIRCTPWTGAAVGEMAVGAFATTGERALRERQSGRFRGKKSPSPKLHCRRAREGPTDNTYRVPQILGCYLDHRPRSSWVTLLVFGQRSPLPIGVALASCVGAIRQRTPSAAVFTRAANSGLPSCGRRPTIGHVVVG
jgi:hypothetical protein